MKIGDPLKLRSIRLRDATVEGLRRMGIPLEMEWSEFARHALQKLVAKKSGGKQNHKGK